MAKGRRTQKRKSMRKPAFNLSQALVGGGHQLDPASVNFGNGGGSAAWEIGQVGDLAKQWNTVMSQTATPPTLGNSFDKMVYGPTPDQLLLAQSGGSRRRSRRMRKYRGGKIKPIVGGKPSKPVVGGKLSKPVIGGSRRTRRRKRMGGNPSKPVVGGTTSKTDRSGDM